MAETTHEALVRQTGAVEELMDYYQGSRADISARVAAKEVEVDAYISGASFAIGAPAIISYDPAVLHSKTSLLSDGMIVDPNANWRTSWFSLAGASIPSIAYLYSGVGDRAFVRASRNWVTSGGGAGDNPPYSSDFSVTVKDFVVANAFATNEQIDQWLVENPGAPNPEISSHGGNTAFSGEVPLITITGEHAYKCLFVRFRNKINPTAIAQGQATDETPLQEITANGGNAFFGLHSVHKYDF